MRQLWDTGTVPPVVAGGLGALGVWGARANVDAAPGIVFLSLVIAGVAVVLRQRGMAVASLGVGAAAAFASPAGLGPLLVATGAVIASQPATIDVRLARWPDLVDGLIAAPALAGLAGVVAAQPSERGLAVGVGSFALAIVSWWRGPRHGDAFEPGHDTVVSYLGMVGGLLLAFVPDVWKPLGVLPEATITAGRGFASALAVFVLAIAAQQLQTEWTKRSTGPAPTAAHRR